jgi:putative transcription factor
LKKSGGFFKEIKMQCDMCGSESELFRTLIESTELKVCGNCAKFGKILGPVKEETEIERKTLRKIEATEPEADIIEMVVSDFSEIIKRKREQTGLNQKEFAKKINEKESIVHKMETGEFKPSIKLARKLEHLLGIKLVEDYEEEHKKSKASESSTLTIGDMIKIKKR